MRNYSKFNDFITAEHDVCGHQSRTERSYLTVGENDAFGPLHRYSMCKECATASNPELVAEYEAELEAEQDELEEEYRDEESMDMEKKPLDEHEIRIIVTVLGLSHTFVLPDDVKAALLNRTDTCNQIALMLFWTVAHQAMMHTPMLKNKDFTGLARILTTAGESQINYDTNDYKAFDQKVLTYSSFADKAFEAFGDEADDNIESVIDHVLEQVGGNQDMFVEVFTYVVASRSLEN